MTPNDSLLCVGGCGKEKTINYIVLECQFFSGTWNLVLCWLGIFSVQPYDIISHARHFGGAHVFTKDIRFCFQMIWFLSKSIT